MLDGSGAGPVEAKVSQRLNAAINTPPDQSQGGRGPRAARTAGQVSTILRGMISRSVLAVCACAAAFGLSSLAQASPSAAPQTSQPATQTQNPTQPSAPLQLHDLPAEPHTLTAAEVQQAKEQQALNAALRLASLQAHWGPEMSTPGLSITMTELGRTKTADGTQIKYQITGSGFAATDRLMLVRWPLDGQASAVMGGIGFDPKGVAVCSGAAAAQDLSSAASNLNSAPAAPGTPGNAQGATPGFTPPPACTTTMKADEPVEIEATAAQGEAIRVALVTEDRKRAAEASAIPFPITNTDKACTLQVILSIKDGTLALLDGTGFPASTQLKLVASTADGSRELHPRTNAQGRIVVPLLTGAKGQKSGTTTVKFAGLNREPTLDTPKEEATPAPDCAPAVSYPWGEGSYKKQ